MSSHKRNFHCFNAVGGDGYKHHTGRIPRIPQHGMVAHREPLEECYVCSEYRHVQALDALETQATPLYDSYMPYLHHHPHHYVLRRPAGPEEHPVMHSGHNHGHIHHHRYNKRVVLVKNSDPSFRKTIVLHRRSLRSFGLFLEEVSALMQYRIRKLYTLEGCKVRSRTVGTRRSCKDNLCFLVHGLHYFFLFFPEVVYVLDSDALCFMNL